MLRTPSGYVMLYVGHAYTDLSKIGGAGGVYLLGATSPDGLTWTKLPEPVFRPGQSTGWMKDGIAEPDLVAGPDGHFYLFFTGLDGEARAIGVARSASPTGPWTFRKNPLLTPGPAGNPDERHVLAPAILIEDDRLRMWYLGYDSKERFSVGHVEGRWPDVVRLR